MNAPLPITVDTTALTKESTTALDAAKTFKCTSIVEYEEAGARLKLIKGLVAKISATFDPHIKRAHDAHKALVAEKNTATAPLTEAERVYKTRMLGFQQEQERVRREQEAKAQEAARREQEKLEARAAKAEASGKVEKAEALRDQAAVIPTPVVQIETPKVTGISTRESWTFEIVDKTLIPDQYKTIDERAIGAVVRALKSAANIPGVRVFPTQSIAARS